MVVPPPERTVEPPLWRLGVFASPAAPLAFLLIPVTYLLPQFYAVHVGVELSAIGAILLLSRAADALLDPLIGQAADHTSSRLGRRRVWMLAATPLVMFGAWALFVPPAGANWAWLLVASGCVYVGASAVTLPHRAWGTDVVTSYDGRTRLAAVMFAAGLAGVLVASLIPAIASSRGHGVDRFTMGLLAAAAIIAAPLTVLAACMVVRDTAEPMAASAPRGGGAASGRSTGVLRTLAGNRPFLLLCSAFLLLDLGNGVFFGTMAFYVLAYLERPDLLGVALLGSVGVSMLFIPAWVRLSSRIGKHRATAAALAGGAVVSGGVFLVPNDQGLLYLGLIGLLGAFGAGFHALPQGMVGDAIDYWALRTGRDRSGLHWGVWYFIQKLSPALALALTLPLLQALGFNPGGPNPDSAVQALRSLHALGLIPFAAVAAAMLLAFPLTPVRQRAIRRRLAARTGQREPWT